MDNFGTVVNAEENWNKEPEKEGTLSLWLGDEMIAKLAKSAKHHNYPSVNDYCIAKLIESMTTKVGAPHIQSPAQISGTSAGKISGPKGGIVTRV